MSRSIQLSLAFLLIVSFLPSAAASTAALHAALRGPERKRESLADASGRRFLFNVKPVSYRIEGAAVQVIGQLSYHVGFAKDKQVWFTIERRGSDQARVGVTSGGLTLPAGPPIVFVRPLPNSTSRFRAWLASGRGWQNAAAKFIERLAAQVSKLEPVRTRPGITVYKHAMLKGTAKSFDLTSVKQLSKHKMNDEVSSLVAFVPRGYVLELFEHSGYKGKKMLLAPGAHVIRSLNIHGRNDDFSSLRFRRK